jgi:hypothetical protein
MSKFRRIVPVVAVILAMLTVSCTSTKKYGCPNHLFTPTLAR